MTTFKEGLTEFPESTGRIHACSLTQKVLQKAGRAWPTVTVQALPMRWPGGLLPPHIGKGFSLLYRADLLW